MGKGEGEAEMIFAIPSKGRANRVKSQQVLPSANVYVPEREMKEYEANGVQNVIPVPNEVKGITATRNWILRNTDDVRIIMVDDDVKTQGWLKLREHRSKKIKLNEEQWIREGERLFDLTEQLGFRIWGVDTLGEPRAVYPYRPFIFRTYVTASFMGILNDGRTYFDESFPVKEDYELCLRCIKEDGGVLGARYVFWANSHWKDTGGCFEYRTQNMELRAIRRLLDLYPHRIRRIIKGGSQYSISLDF